ncbi:programmed cell death 1 ligand 1-like [Stigmatopora argus]
MSLLKALIMQILFQQSLQVFFTTSVERASYTADFGENLTMGCRFKPVLQNINVSWHWISSAGYRQVCRVCRGQEQVAFQHPDFRGRAGILAQEIENGWAKLQLSNVRINDTGTYRCVLQTRKGADYKDIRLSVTAPYKTDSQGQHLNASTAVVSTEENLMRITSAIRVPSSQRGNYTCRFQSSASSATFLIPEELQKRSNPNVAIIVAISILLICFALLLIYLYRKGLFRRERDMSACHEKLQARTTYPKDFTLGQQGEIYKHPYADYFRDANTGFVPQEKGLELDSPSAKKAKGIKCKVLCRGHLHKAGRPNHLNVSSERPLEVGRTLAPLLGETTFLGDEAPSQRTVEGTELKKK